MSQLFMSLYVQVVFTIKGLHCHRFLGWKVTWSDRPCRQSNQSLLIFFKSLSRPAPRRPSTSFKPGNLRPEPPSARAPRDPNVQNGKERNRKELREDFGAERYFWGTLWTRKGRRGGGGGHYVFSSYAQHNRKQEGGRAVHKETIDALEQIVENKVQKTYESGKETKPTNSNKNSRVMRSSGGATSRRSSVRPLKNKNKKNTRKQTLWLQVKSRMRLQKVASINVCWCVMRDYKHTHNACMYPHSRMHVHVCAQDRKYIFRICSHIHLLRTS